MPFRGQSEISSTALGDEKLFQKKQECQKYAPQIEKKLEASGSYNSETGLQTFSHLEKTFYSPKANSCLYVAQEWWIIGGKPNSEIWTLVDALSGEALLSDIREVNKNKPEYFSQQKAFEELLKDYE